MRALVFDTETTGLVANHSVKLDLQPEVIEFCGLLVDLETGDVIDEVDTLVKPVILPLPDKIVKITNLTDAMLEDAPPFADVASKIIDLIEAAPLVIAHNLSFDKEVMDIQVERLGRSKVAWPQGTCTVEQTVHLAGRRLKLGELYERLFGEVFVGAHRARADVEALVRICRRLAETGDI